MTPTVFFMLVTERSHKLAPTALHAFETLRVGFPHAPITVYSNASPAADEIGTARPRSTRA